MIYNTIILIAGTALVCLGLARSMNAASRRREYLWLGVAAIGTAMCMYGALA